MERISSPDVDEQRTHYADIMGRVACLRAMAWLGEQEQCDRLYPFADNPDKIILNLSKQVAEEKYETFLDTVKTAQLKSVQNITTPTLGVLEHTRLLQVIPKLTPASNFERLEQAITMAQTEQGWDEIGADMLSSTLTSISPFQLQIVKDNIYAVLPDHDSLAEHDDQNQIQNFISKTKREEVYLNLKEHLSSVHRHTEFYADLYYEEENLKKW